MSAVYSADCACWLVEIGCAQPGVTVERHAAERSACLAFLGHANRHRVDNVHRYWAVHGPGGHVIAVRP